MNSSKTWHTIDDCLWETVAPIPGKVTLSDEYDELKYFFVERLGVRTPNLSMVVSELEALCTRNPSVQEVVGLIWAINSMAPQPGDLTSLNPLEIFPVKSPESGGQVHMRSRLDDFIILDHPRLTVEFHGRISALDFSPEQVKRLQRFFASMSMSDKFISTRVIENTEAQGGRISESLSLEFRNRGYAIAR